MVWQPHSNTGHAHVYRGKYKPYCRRYICTYQRKAIKFQKCFKYLTDALVCKFICELKLRVALRKNPSLRDWRRT